MAAVVCAVGLKYRGRCLRVGQVSLDVHVVCFVFCGVARESWLVVGDGVKDWINAGDSHAQSFPHSTCPRESCRR